MCGITAKKGFGHIGLEAAVELLYIASFDLPSGPLPAADNLPSGLGETDYFKLINKILSILSFRNFVHPIVVKDWPKFL